MADQAARQSAVIFNPIKVADDFRDTVSRRLSEAGWSEPLWLETAEDDPGRSMAAQAREAGVDLVLAAGGDGTVRVVADGLAGSKITMAVLPSGTANLLALNLGIPKPLDQALDVALAGHTKTVDLIKISVDGNEGEHYAVMAGVGVDAMIMDETRPESEGQDRLGGLLRCGGQGPRPAADPDADQGRRSSHPPAPGHDLPDRQREPADRATSA